MTNKTTWKPSPITCGGCAAKWTAHSWAHCGACHRTFSGVSLFDLHRSADGDHGTCLDPATIRDKTGQPRFVYRDGAWRWPEMSPEERTTLEARAGTVTQRWPFLPRRPAQEPRTPPPPDDHTNPHRKPLRKAHRP